MDKNVDGLRERGTVRSLLCWLVQNISLHSDTRRIEGLRPFVSFAFFSASRYFSRQVQRINVPIADLRFEPTYMLVSAPPYLHNGGGSRPENELQKFLLF